MVGTILDFYSGTCQDSFKDFSDNGSYGSSETGCHAVDAPA